MRPSPVEPGITSPAPRGLTRHILLDLEPLRISRGYRALVAGQGVPVIGSLIGTELLPTSNAIVQSLLQTGVIVGPAVAGLLLAGAGVHAIYWLDVATFAATLAAVCSIAAWPPPPEPDGARRWPG